MTTRGSSASYVIASLLFSLSIGIQMCTGQTTNTSNVVTPTTNASVAYSAISCHIRPIYEDMHTHVTGLRVAGAKLIRYHIKMTSYGNQTADPLYTDDMLYNYEPHFWHRVFSKHGRTLLALAFNYDMLSMMMLTFGVEDVTVEVEDVPPRCFLNLTEVDKVAVIRSLLLDDLRVDDPGIHHRPRLEDENFVCNQLIIPNPPHAEFSHQCCTGEDEYGRPFCHGGMSHVYIDAMYIVIILMKVAFFLLGPYYLQGWIYKRSLTKENYVVKLKTPVEVEVGGEERRKYKAMHMRVNHDELMTEKAVPVGVFLFLYEKIIKCGMREHEPMTSCCKNSICGSWNTRCFATKEPGNSGCFYGKWFFSWGLLFQIIGGLIFLAAIPLPYYLRLLIYYGFERPEINHRHAAAKKLGLHIGYEHNLLQYLTPVHSGLLVMYCMYFITLAFIVLFREIDRKGFNSIVRGAVQDMRSIQYNECLRLLLCHFLLPFERFGILCGFLVGMIYWPIALPCVLLVCAFYCFPTVYLCGRLLVHSRRWLCLTCCHRCSRFCYNSPNIATGDSFSEDAHTCESCCLLDRISPPSPPGDEGLRRSSVQKGKRYECCGLGSWNATCSKVSSVLIGLVCVANMICMLLMYAECFGFVVEILVLTLMGVIVNASSAARYAMLVFWIMMYCSKCYNDMYDDYMKLNSRLFSYIKDKLGEDIQKVTRMKEEFQRPTGFKYFTRKELDEWKKKRQNLTDADLLNSEGEEEEETVDSLREGKWDVTSLVMFVDSKDVPRIPQKLFHNITKLDIPGSPGPVYRSLLRATIQLMYMIIFLVFVFFVIMSFGDFYAITTTNQMLLTLASGFLPFVIRTVLAPSHGELNMNSYSFDGKIFNIIQSYHQSWPAIDLDKGLWHEPGSSPGSGPGNVVINMEEASDTESEGLLADAARAAMLIALTGDDGAGSDIRRSRDDIRRSRDDIRRSRGDVTRHGEDATRLQPHVDIHGSRHSVASSVDAKHGFEDREPLQPSGGMEDESAL